MFLSVEILKEEEERGGEGKQIYKHVESGVIFSCKCTTNTNTTSASILLTSQLCFDDIVVEAV